MKGIILAGGTGTRLGSLTKGVNKHLLPIFDKPMIYYPLSTLILAGVKEVLIIVRPQDKSAYFDLLGTGTRLGINIFYEEQHAANGIAEAPILAEQFLQGDPCWLHLGDNIFYGEGLTAKLKKVSSEKKTTIFIKKVRNPSDFGVVELDVNDGIVRIVEKPANPQSDWAAVGLYFLDGTACDRAKNLKPSSRGELEIADLMECFLDDKLLSVVKLGRGTTWLDTGNPNDLFDAAQFVKIIQDRQEQLVGSPEEASFTVNNINREQLSLCVSELRVSQYKKYLERLL